MVIMELILFVLFLVSIIVKITTEGNGLKAMCGYRQPLEEKSRIAGVVRRLYHAVVQILQEL